MWLPRPSGLCALLVFSVFLHTCLAVPSHRLQAEDSLVSNREPSALQPRVQISTVRVVQFLSETITIGAPDDANPSNNDVWRICLEHVSQVLSINAGLNIDLISNVASKLVRLYDLAMATIFEIIETHGYSVDPADDRFSLSLGQVAIEWGCKLGPLCWHLLYDFCLIMKEKARQGWTGIYSGELVNVGTGVVTWVKLSIRSGREGG